MSDRSSSPPPALRVRVQRLHDTQRPLPRYMSDGAAGMDLEADLAEPVLLQPGERRAIPTGFAFEIPLGYEGQPRASLCCERSGRVPQDVADRVCC